MKKTLLFAFSIALALIINSSITQNAYTNSSGAPSGRAGNPAASNQTCSTCHGENESVSTNVLIELSQNSVPVTGNYTPGATYDLKLSLSGGSTAQSGFEITSENSAGLIGTWIAGTGSKFAGGNTKYITHSTPKSGTTLSWNMQWTAPAAGAGTITFYAVIRCNNQGIYTNTAVFNESAGSGVEIASAKNLSLQSVYTNNGTIDLNLQAGKSSPLNITVYNLQGAEVFAQKNNISAGMNQISLPINQAKGMYIVKIATPEAVLAKKVIL